MIYDLTASCILSLLQLFAVGGRSMMMHHVLQLSEEQIA